jgi:outer membrane phospholipase A
MLYFNKSVSKIPLFSAYVEKFGYQTNIVQSKRMKFRFKINVLSKLYSNLLGKNLRYFLSFCCLIHIETIDKTSNERA